MRAWHHSGGERPRARAGPSSTGGEWYREPGSTCWGGAGSVGRARGCPGSLGDPSRKKGSRRPSLVVGSWSRGAEQGRSREPASGAGEWRTQSGFRPGRVPLRHQHRAETVAVAASGARRGGAAGRSGLGTARLGVSAGSSFRPLVPGSWSGEGSSVAALVCLALRACSSRKCFQRELLGSRP